MALNGHPYWAKRIIGPELGDNNPFRLLAEGIPSAREQMDRQTLVLVGATFEDGKDGFILLADHVDLTINDRASGEELQDHDCAIVSNQTAKSPVADATNLKFREMFKWPVGPRGLEPSEKLLRLDGRPVRIVGYMVEQETMRSFILAPLPIKLGDEDENLADDIPPGVVFVHSVAPESPDLRYRPGLLELTGTLSVGSFAEADGRTSTVRLTLDPTMSEEITHHVPR